MRAAATKNWRKRSATTNVISFVAWGGVGKSTLVNKWIERVAAENYRGARRRLQARSAGRQ